MRVVLFLCAILYTSLPHIQSLPISIDPRFEQAHISCAEVTGIPVEMVESAFDGDFSNASPNFKEHALCMGKKLNFVNDAGDIQTTTIRNMFLEYGYDEDFAEGILGKCAKTMDTPADTTIHLAECVFQNIRT